LDDFGTGYSSMAYLRRLPISKLKIDRAFIANIQNTDTDLAMVRTMIEMAHVLGLKVIAEGVETEEQVTLLQQLQCDELQGFYYSKPVVAGEMKKWWKPAPVAEVHRIHGSLN
jgi:EAL domain-containing protein (putative c-di-GMP-specific phosphodiesterase class I)